LSIILSFIGIISSEPWTSPSDSRRIRTGYSREDYWNWARNWSIETF